MTTSDSAGFDAKSDSSDGSTGSDGSAGSGFDAKSDRSDVSDISGAILTGGASRRMGRTKALLEVDGVPMGALVAAALRDAGCTDVILVGGDVDELSPLEVPIIADRYPREGPVGGVLTALGHASSGHVVVVACDLPGLEGETIRQLCGRIGDDVDVVVAMTDRREPAVGVWRRACAPRVHTLFDAGVRAMHEVLDQLRVVEVAVDPAAVRNVNRPDDVAGSATQA